MQTKENWNAHAKRQQPFRDQIIVTKQQSANAFQALLNEKVRHLVYSFSSISRQLFVDSNGSLVHTGEFGTYREEIVKEYLQAFVPQRMTIDRGFVITDRGRISTQCDIVIYDKTVTPLLQNENRQRFFPVESVCAIGEIKSVVSLQELKDALLKLATVKLLRDSLWEPAYLYTVKEGGKDSKYCPESDQRDQILSFLFCESFSFDLNKENLQNILSCYTQEHPIRPQCLWHNMVVSIKDGLIAYFHPAGAIFPFPIKSFNFQDLDGDGKVQSERVGWKKMAGGAILPKESESIEHIRMFSTMLHQGLNAISVFYPDMSRYWESQEDVWHFDLSTPSP